MKLHDGTRQGILTRLRCRPEQPLTMVVELLGNGAVIADNGTLYFSPAAIARAGRLLAERTRHRIDDEVLVGLIGQLLQEVMK